MAQTVAILSSIRLLLPAAGVALKAVSQRLPEKPAVVAAEAQMQALKAPVQLAKVRMGALAVSQVAAPAVEGPA